MNLYLKSNQVDNAKASLNLAIQKKQKKSFNARMIFILAQLYHREGDFKASELYNNVIEMNPDYEMAFQAKINRALSFNDGDTKAIKQQLLKMLKDDKNIDFFDILREIFDQKSQWQAKAKASQATCRPISGGGSLTFLVKNLMRKCQKSQCVLLGTNFR